MNASLEGCPSNLAASKTPSSSMTIPVLLCDGCHQPVATVDGILGYDEGVKESAKDAFRYKLSLFNATVLIKTTSSGAVASTEEEQLDSTRRRRRSQHDGVPSRCPSRGGVRQEDEEASMESPRNTELENGKENEEDDDDDDDDDDDGFWAYSALNPSKQRFDLLRVKPFLSLAERKDDVPGVKKVESALSVKASPFYFSGEYSPEHTFFIGYQWQQCSCNVCGKFLGWGFAKEEPLVARESAQSSSSDEHSGLTRIIPSDTSPEFVGLILRMCTSKDNYPRESLEKLLASSLRRQQQCHALREFSRKWLDLLRERPTDLLVHSLVRAYHQRRQEFLKIISDSDGAGMWIGQDHPRPPSLSASPTIQGALAENNASSSSPHDDSAVPHPSTEQGAATTESLSMGSSNHNTNNTDGDNAVEGIENNQDHLRNERDSVTQGEIPSMALPPGRPPHPLQPPPILTSASTSQAQRGEEEEEWNHILSFLPSCFAGLLAAARTLPLIQEPVIGVYDGNVRGRRTAFASRSGSTEVEGALVDSPSRGRLVHNHASSDFHMDAVFDSDDDDDDDEGLVTLEEDGEDGILITRRIPSGVQLQAALGSEEEQEGGELEELEGELYELMEASTSSEEGWSTETEEIFHDSD